MHSAAYRSDLDAQPAATGCRGAPEPAEADYGDDFPVPPDGADEPPPGPPGASEEQKGRRSLADRVLELLAELELAHDESGEGYALPIVGGARQVLPIRSKPFRDYVRLQCFVACQKGMNAEVLAQVVETIAARARYAAPHAEIFCRVAGLENEIALDLGDDTWRAVRVTPNDWRIVDRPAALIARNKDARAIPPPRSSEPGALERVFDLFRLSPRERTLVRVWLLAAIRGRKPFPALVIVGEAGAGKSTLAEFLLSLVDPTAAGLRAPPREERDLVAAARHSYVVAFENVSNIGPELADSICRLATGAGIGGRALFTDHEDAAFYAARPVLLNGIPDLPDRADLLDRSLIVTLVNVPDEKRLLEEEVKGELEALRPAVLAELLDAASRGLARFPALKAELGQRRRRLPRMADAALWAEACGVADAVEVMLGAREEGLAEAAAADPVAAAIRRIVAANHGEWTGPSAELLKALDAGLAGARPPSGWPKSPKGLSDKVRRLAPALRAAGLEVETVRTGPNSVRAFRIREYGKTSARPAREPEKGEISSADQGLGIGQIVGQIEYGDLPGSARSARRSARICPICPDLPDDLPDSKALRDQGNSTSEAVSGRSGRCFPLLSNGDRGLAELAAALADGAFHRANALFGEVFGRAPAPRELTELAKLGSPERIRAELEALAREVPA